MKESKSLCSFIGKSWIKLSMLMFQEREMVSIKLYWKPKAFFYILFIQS